MLKDLKSLRSSINFKLPNQTKKRFSEKQILNKNKYNKTVNFSILNLNFQNFLKTNRKNSSPNSKYKNCFFDNRAYSDEDINDIGIKNF